MCCECPNFWILCLAAEWNKQGIISKRKLLLFSSVWSCWGGTVTFKYPLLRIRIVLGNVNYRIVPKFCFFHCKCDDFATTIYFKDSTTMKNSSIAAETINRKITNHQKTESSRNKKKDHPDCRTPSITAGVDYVAESSELTNRVVCCLKNPWRRIASLSEHWTAHPCSSDQCIHLPRYQLCATLE